MIFPVKNDFETLEKGFIIYDALYAASKARRVIERDSEKLKSMDHSERISYIKSQITDTRSW